MPPCPRAYVSAASGLRNLFLGLHPATSLGFGPLCFSPGELWCRFLAPAAQLQTTHCIPTVHCHLKTHLHTIIRHIPTPFQQLVHDESRTHRPSELIRALSYFRASTITVLLALCPEAHFLFHGIRNKVLDRVLNLFDFAPIYFQLFHPTFRNTTLLLCPRLLAHKINPVRPRHSTYHMPCHCMYFIVPFEG